HGQSVAVMVQRASLTSVPHDGAVDDVGVFVVVLEVGLDRSGVVGVLDVPDMLRQLISVAAHEGKQLRLCGLGGGQGVGAHAVAEADDEDPHYGGVDGLYHRSDLIIFGTDVLQNAVGGVDVLGRGRRRRGRGVGLLSEHVADGVDGGGVGLVHEVPPGGSGWLMSHVADVSSARRSSRARASWASRFQRGRSDSAKAMKSSSSRPSGSSRGSTRRARAARSWSLTWSRREYP